MRTNTRARIEYCGNPKQKWGPALLPAPTAPSEGSAGVRNLVCQIRRPDGPFSILAHQLRRRVPFDCALRREAFRFTRPRCPRARLSFNRPAGPKTRHSKFRGPSWDDRSCVPLCLSPIRRLVRAASRWREDHLFRRLFPTCLWLASEEAPQLPVGWRSDLSSLPPEGGWDFRPDHQATMRLAPSRSKRKSWVQACG
jgi:hypothetical protein